MSNYGKLSEEVYNYVVNEIYEGNSETLITEIVENRGFGGYPWYSQIPDWVRELPLEFDRVISDEGLFNELSQKLWDLETKPYFEDISKTNYPEYYDGFNKPSEEWTDEEWDMSWDYHTNSESINEVYIGILSFLSTYVEEYIFTNKSRKLYQTLLKYIPKDRVDYNYYNMTEEGDSFSCLWYLDEEKDIIIQIECSCESNGDLSVEVELGKVNEYGYTEESYFNEVYYNLEELEKDLKEQISNFSYIESV